MSLIKSFADCSALKSVAEKMEEQGLLENDNEWKETLLEASRTMSSKPLRELFIHILFHNEPMDYKGLWNLVTDDTNQRTLNIEMSEDFRTHRGQLCNNRSIPINSDDINQCIYALDDLMREISNGAKGFIDHYDIKPTGERRELQRPIMRAVNEELSYDQQEQNTIYERDYPRLNANQKLVFDEIYNAINEKKVVYTLLMHQVEQERHSFAIYY